MLWLLIDDTLVDLLKFRTFRVAAAAHAGPDRFVVLGDDVLPIGGPCYLGEAEARLQRILSALEPSPPTPIR